MIISDTVPVKITADYGFILTNGDVASKEVYLGKEDSADNWSEIRDERIDLESEEE